MEDEMGEACATYGKEEKCVFDSKYLKGKYIVTCRRVRVTKVTGYGSDDWIY
jgi:hypothetical protein